VRVAVDPARADRAIELQITDSTNEGASDGAQSLPPLPAIERRWPAPWRGRSTTSRCLRSAPSNGGLWTSSSTLLSCPVKLVRSATSASSRDPVGEAAPFTVGGCGDFERVVL